MNGHLQFDEDFELYAIGALDVEEKATFESHLKDCEDCAAKLVSARQRIALLGLAAPAAIPPASVKGRLIERIREESAQIAEHQVKAPKQSWWQTLWTRPITAWAFVVIIATVAAALVNNNYQLRRELQVLQGEMILQQTSDTHDRAVADLLTSPETQRVVLTQATEAPHPEGRIYYHPRLGLLFYASNLPAAPSARVYQLWLVPIDGAPISAGVFEPNQKGEASIVLPKLQTGVTAKAFAVTVEPAGGVPQPTGPKILIGLV